MKKYTINMSKATVFGYVGLRMLGDRATMIGVDLYVVEMTDFEKDELLRDGVEIIRQHIG